MYPAIYLGICPAHVLLLAVMSLVMQLYPVDHQVNCMFKLKYAYQIISESGMCIATTKPLLFIPSHYFDIETLRT